MRLIALLLLPAFIDAIPINNGLAGEPEVQCGPTSVQISFTTDNPFEGVVYAKGHHADESCVSTGSGSSGGGIEMNFETWNVRRQRSLDPRGISVTATVVVQFHRSVLTKVDRAFHIRCFYMEADKTVDAELEVSMVTTELRTFNVPMPVCSYQIQDQSGNPVRFVTIGDKVVHKWDCVTDTTDTFCMEVYDCYVDDGSGSEESRLILVDNDGCAQDGNLLPNPEYTTDLNAEAESHVFKYADRPQLYFNCQIRIGVKEPNGECQAYRGDQCPNPLETTGRKRRSVTAVVNLNRTRHHNDDYMDVSPASPLFVADVELTNDDIPTRLRQALNGFSRQQPELQAPVVSAGDVCLSGPMASSALVILAIFFVSAAGMGLYLLFSRQRK